MIDSFFCAPHAGQLTQSQLDRTVSIVGTAADIPRERVSVFADETMVRREALERFLAGEEETALDLLAVARAMAA